MIALMEVRDGDRTVYINPAQIVEVWPERTDDALTLHLLFAAPGWVFTEDDAPGPYTLCLEGAEAERVLSLLLSPALVSTNPVRCPHCHGLFVSELGVKIHQGHSRACRDAAERNRAVTSLTIGARA